MSEPICIETGRLCDLDCYDPSARWILPCISESAPTPESKDAADE